MIADPLSRALAEHVRRVTAEQRAGARRLGWKVAFNAPAIQSKLGLPYSLIAGLTQATVLPADSELALRGRTAIALEAEVAVYLSETLEPEMTPDEITGYVESWGPAIEVVEFDRPFSELATIVTEGVFHRAVCLGERCATPVGADLGPIRARVEYGGSLVCDLNAREATGHAPEVLAHLARLLAPTGEKLRSGDVIILGAMNPLTFAQPDARFSLTLSGLGSVALQTVA